MFLNLCASELFEDTQAPSQHSQRTALTLVLRVGSSGRIKFRRVTGFPQEDLCTGVRLSASVALRIAACPPVVKKTTEKRYTSPRASACEHSTKTSSQPQSARLRSSPFRRKTTAPRTVRTESPSLSRAWAQQPDEWRLRAVEPGVLEPAGCEDYQAGAAGKQVRPLTKCLGELAKSRKKRREDEIGVCVCVFSCFFS